MTPDRGTAFYGDSSDKILAEAKRYLWRMYAIDCIQAQLIRKYSQKISQYPLLGKINWSNTRSVTSFGVTLKQRSQRSQREIKYL